MEEQMTIDSAMIKKLREERSWSQEHLASVTGLSLRTIQRIESEGSASLESRMAIAAAFGVLPAALIKRALRQSTAETTTVRSFPGKPLGIVFGLSGAMLGTVYAMTGIEGTVFEYGIVGAWIGLTCGVAGVVFNRYSRKDSVTSPA